MDDKVAKLSLGKLWGNVDR